MSVNLILPNTSLFAPLAATNVLLGQHAKRGSSVYDSVTSVSAWQSHDHASNGDATADVRTRYGTEEGTRDNKSIRTSFV